MVCFIPYSNSRSYFSRPNMNFDIQIKVNQSELMDAASWSGQNLLLELLGICHPLDETDFNIEKSDNIANLLLENIKNITLVATIIGFITFLVLQLD